MTDDRTELTRFLSRIPEARRALHRIEGARRFRRQLYGRQVEYVQSGGLLYGAKLVPAGVVPNTLRSFDLSVPLDQQGYWLLLRDLKNYLFGDSSYRLAVVDVERTVAQIFSEFARHGGPSVALV